jgi:hypothetical protein
VGDLRGRLRIIGGRTYTDTGRALTLGPNGRLITGDRHLFEEVATTTIFSDSDSMVLTRGFGPDAVEGPGNAVAPEVVTDAVADLSLRLGGGSLCASADPQAPLAGPDLTPAAAPEDPEALKTFPEEIDEGAGLETEEIEPQMKYEK